MKPSHPPLRNNPLISIRNLTVGFDQTPVFEQLNLTFYQGDRVALIGANGSGKTTLLKTILGLVEKSFGTVDIEKNVRIGYLPQVLQIADRQFPMSVREVIQQGLLSKRPFPRFIKNEDRIQMDIAIKKAGIEPLLDQRYGYLSMGQKQLVLFVRMLLQKPDIVFLDEPTSSLDVSRKDSIYQMLAELTTNHVAYVIITHDLPSFNETIDRVILLEHSILFDGNHREFCENKAFSPFIHAHGHTHEHL
jgi:zinc transport system ATP-binding protein